MTIHWRQVTRRASAAGGLLVALGRGLGLAATVAMLAGMALHDHFFEGKPC